MNESTDNKVKMIMIVYENGDKQFFNYYRSKPAGPANRLTQNSKGLAEVKKINEVDPETYEELAKTYEYYYD